MALDIIAEKGQITNRQYQELTGISSRQVLRELSELEKQGLIVRHGRGRSTHYQAAKETTE